MSLWKELFNEAESAQEVVIKLNLDVTDLESAVSKIENLAEENGYWGSIYYWLTIDSAYANDENLNIMDDYFLKVTKSLIKDFKRETMN